MKSVIVKKYTPKDVFIYAEGEVIYLDNEITKFEIDPPCAFIINHPETEIKSSCKMIDEVQDETIFVIEDNEVIEIFD